MPSQFVMDAGRDGALRIPYASMSALVYGPELCRDGAEPGPPQGPVRGEYPCSVSQGILTMEYGRATVPRVSAGLRADFCSALQATFCQQETTCG